MVPSDGGKAQNIDNFSIVCKNCETAKKMHETNLYVDWNKKYYMIVCYTCGTTEAFNKNGKKIELRSKIN